MNTSIDRKAHHAPTVCGAWLAGLLCCLALSCGITVEPAPTPDPGTTGAGPGHPGVSGPTNPDGDPSSSPGSAAPGDPTSPGTPGLPGVPATGLCSAQGGGERAVIVAAGNIKDVTQGSAALLTINNNGLLADTQVRLGPIDRPHAIALRDDSREAVISWGTTSSDRSTPHGVVVISLAPDGSQATIAQQLALDGNFGPLSIGYTSADSLVVSRIGPGKDNLLQLNRGGGGKLTAGARYNVPGEFPQRVLALPRDAGEALYLQANLTGGPGSNLFRISEGASGIAPIGEPLFFEDGPLFLYMHPKLNVAYMPGSDPGSVSGSSYTNPNPKGRLRVLTPNAKGKWSLVDPPFALPHAASLAGIAPDGEFMILADAVGGTRQWEITMVQLDAAGRPTAASAPLASFDASMVYSVEVTPEGHVVVSRSQTTKGGDVISFARTGPDTWTQCPTSVPFDGAPRLRVAR